MKRPQWRRTAPTRRAAQEGARSRTESFGRDERAGGARRRCPRTYGGLRRRGGRQSSLDPRRNGAREGGLEPCGGSSRSRPRVCCCSWPSESSPPRSRSCFWRAALPSVRFLSASEAWLRNLRTARIAHPAITWVLGSVAFCAWLVFLVGAIADSMWTTDFVAFWGYKGKVVFLTSEIPRRLFDDPALYFAHKEYPLLVPLSLAAIALVVGEWNDQALALLYPACEAVTLLALFGFLHGGSRGSPEQRQRRSRPSVSLYRPANAGTSEVPLALGLVLLVSAALDFLRRDASASAWRLSVAALFCATLKQEGPCSRPWLRSSFSGACGSRTERPGYEVRQRSFRLQRCTGSRSTYFEGVRPGDYDLTLFIPDRWTELPSRFESVVTRIFGPEMLMCFRGSLRSSLSFS